MGNGGVGLAWGMQELASLWGMEEKYSDSQALGWRVDLQFFRSAPLGCRVSSIIMPPSDRIIAGMLATLGRPMHSNELEGNGLHGQPEFMEGPEWRDAVQIILMCWSNIPANSAK